MITLGFVVLFILVLNTLFDLKHLCNTILIVIYSLCTLKFPDIWRYHLLDENFMHNVCLTSDLDLFMHMNNSRYLRDCDFARTKMWVQNKVWQVLRKMGGTFVLGGCSVRYRKPITLFTVYTINSQVLYWDSKAFYVEQKFVRRSDGFVCCVVLAKQSLIGVTMDQLIEGFDYPLTRPECPAKLTKWIEYNEMSSEQLKKKR